MAAYGEKDQVKCTAKERDLDDERDEILRWVGAMRRLVGDGRADALSTRNDGVALLGEDDLKVGFAGGRRAFPAAFDRGARIDVEAGDFAGVE